MLAPWQCKCPECGSIASCEYVDVDVGYHISGDFVCTCGWEDASDGKMRVRTYADYFPQQENTMGTIKVTEFMLPNAARREVEIDVHADVQTKAEALIGHGLSFTMERLRTGDVVYYITDDSIEDDADMCIVNANDALDQTKRTKRLERMIAAFDWEKYKAERDALPAEVNFDDDAAF